MREFETRVRQDTDEIYMRLDDEQSERQLLAGWLNMLFRDRRAHTYTRHLMETKARLSREAWVRSTDANDLVHETSSHHVDSSNMHTFYQRYPSEHRWTKDHPIEQVNGNPSQSIRTRRQLESDAEM
nr:integrase, catalytic region, zinc finger, CCHC-type, peptidase aspartic, catalytic [Tanacetum cinerariifolium]